MLIFLTITFVLVLWFYIITLLSFRGNLTVLLRHGKTIMENILLELFNLKMLEKGVLIKEIKRFRRNTMRMSCDVISDDDKDYVYVRPNCVLR